MAILVRPNLHYSWCPMLRLLCAIAIMMPLFEEAALACKDPEENVDKFSGKSAAWYTAKVESYAWFGFINRKSPDAPVERVFMITVQAQGSQHSAADTFANVLFTDGTKVRLKVAGQSGGTNVSASGTATYATVDVTTTYGLELEPLTDDQVKLFTSQPVSDVQFVRIADDGSDARWIQFATKPKLAEKAIEAAKCAWPTGA